MRDLRTGRHGRGRAAARTAPAQCDTVDRRGRAATHARKTGRSTSPRRSGPHWRGARSSCATGSRRRRSRTKALVASSAWPRSSSAAPTPPAASNRISCSCSTSPTTSPRHAVAANRDRMERAGADFHARVRAAYRDPRGKPGLGRHRRQRNPDVVAARVRDAVAAPVPLVSAAMFADVVGQDRAIATLRARGRPTRARVPARGPTRVGRRGSRAGVRDVAHRGRRRRTRPQPRARGVHPDVVEFEPSGASYLVDADVANASCRKPRACRSKANARC